MTFENTNMDTTTEDVVVPPSSHDLFERMLEEQLRLENAKNPHLQQQADDPMGETSAKSEGNLISSSNWKERCEAYDQLITTLSTTSSDNDFIENGKYLSQCATEKNHAALEKGLQVVLCFVTHYKQASKTAVEIVPLVIKAYPSTKQSVVKLVNDILLMYTEIDCGVTVLEQLLYFGQAANEKNPKTRSLSIQCIALLLRNFGQNAIAIKSILPKMPLFLSEVNITIKTQATELIVELYRWLKDSLVMIMDTWEIKPAQKKDLLALFDKEKETTSAPIRAVRSGKVMDNSIQVKSAKPQEEEIDPMELLEPQDVLSKIPNEWESEVTSVKWAERKKALVDLFELVARYPKLKSGDYYPLIGKLAVIIESDKNAVVIKQAIEVCEQLCKGLRSSFTYASTVVPLLFQKFKDKKLIDAASKTLDSIDKFSQPIEDFIDSYTSELDLKSHAVSKQGCLSLLESCLSRKKALHTHAHKVMAQKFIELSDDASAGVRESSLRLLARLQWLGGDRFMSSFLAKLDKTKMEKVTQALNGYGASPVGSATVSSSVTSIPVSTEEKPAPPKRAVSAPKTSKPVAPRTTARSSSTLPSAASRPLTSSRVPAKPTSGTTAKKPVAQKSAPEEDIDTKSSLSKEEVIEKAKEIIASDIITGFTSAKWSERVEALKQLETFVTESSDVVELHKEIIVRYIGYVPGWGESNLQVVTKLIEVVTLIVSQSTTFSKGALVSSIEGIVEKLATAKAKDAGKVCLSSIAELLNPQFPFSLLYKKLLGHKNPKITAEGIMWMSSTVADFGVSYIKVDQLIEFIKACLENTNPAIKKNCTSLLCEMRKYMGDGLLDFLSDVKPALLSSIKTEFEKMPQVTNVIPVKQVRGEDAAPIISGAVGDLPRTDIKSRISSKILKNLDDGNWKNRLAAVNEIEQLIIEANKRIQPTLSELINALKKRLDDPNVKTLTTTLSLLILVATATGPSVEKYCKLILPNIITKLSHNNKAVRTLALSVLEAWVEIITLEPMLKFFPKGLSTEKGHPEGRKDVLTFIVTHLPTIKQRDAPTFEPIVKTIIESIQDPKPDIRKLAEQILPEIVAAIGVEEVRKYCRDLKPAFRQTVNAILDKYIDAVPSIPVVVNNQPEVSRILLASNAQIPTPVLSQSASSPMEIDDDVEEKSVTQPVLTSSFKQPRTVVRRPVVEAVPSSEPVAVSTRVHEQITQMPVRSVPTLNIAELDGSQPISIQKLIGAIQIDRTNDENTINALKKLVEILNNDRRAVVPHVKELVDCLTSGIQNAFELATAGLISIRLCKYLLNTKMILFSKRNIMELIDKDTLQNLIHQLLTRLLDEKLPLLEDGQNLLRAFNQLMINILQNSNRTSTYTSLLNLLASSHDKLHMKKYTELVVKCLLKLTKALESTVDRIQIDILLMDLHEFLTANPPTQFKNKDDLPLRTVKTILNELVKVKGPSIRTHLSFIPTHKNPLIVSYIELMLTNAQKQKEKDTESIQNISTEADETNNTQEANEMLNDIFNCISNKDTCNTGLFRLYKFKKTYPSANINIHLSRCSEVFQVYIKRQLAKIEEHESRSSQNFETRVHTPQPQTETADAPKTTKPSYGLSSMDAIRAEVKRRQHEMQQLGNINPEDQALSRSLSVQDIRRRFREVKVNNASDLPMEPPQFNDQPLANVPASSDQLEALKNRIRAKAKQQQMDEQRRRSSSLSQSTDAAALRARLAATQAKFVREEEKENQSDLSNLKERLARLN